MYRMRDLADDGARISFGSDWPVSSPNALRGVATAVTRSLPNKAGWTIEQALSPIEALQAYTSGSAAQLSNSQRTGLLLKGAAAEFVVLSANPFDLQPQDLHSLRVLATNLPDQPAVDLT
jgi:predicted amidohydrolase YtcJ